MVKGNKDPIPNISSVQNRDIIQRLNFLYQASVYLQNLSSQTTSNPASTPKGEDQHAGKGRKRRRQRIRTTDELSRAYINTMVTVGKKTTVKMDPSIKRTLCKNCQSVLVPGLSVRVRVRRSTSHRHALELSCSFCGFERRIPAPPRIESSTNLPENDLDLCSGVSVEDVETKDPQEPVVEPDHTRRKRRKRRRPRKQRKKETDEGGLPTIKRLYPPLPLALRRDAGHAVFCGNERVDMNMDVINESGDGMFAV